MDLGTIGHKLQEGQYMSMEDVKKDIELVFANCRQFNPATTYPCQCADAVERVFKKEWPKAMERKLNWTEKRGLVGIMTTIVKEPVYVLSFCPHTTLLNGIFTVLGFSLNP